MFEHLEGEGTAIEQVCITVSLVSFQYLYLCVSRTDELERHERKFHREKEQLEQDKKRFEFAFGYWYMYHY